MSAKSPYELRTELLAMAMSICQEKHNAEYSKLLHDINMARINNNDDFIPWTRPNTAPTTEEIIQEATKLNEFIQNKN